MKSVALSAVKDDLSKYLRLAESEDIVITRHGKPAGVLIGFRSEDDWFEFRLMSDPRFVKRIQKARENLKAGKGRRLEDVRKGGAARHRRRRARLRALETKSGGILRLRAAAGRRVAVTRCGSASPVA